MKWATATIALAFAVPAAGAASTNFFDTYEECKASLAWQSTIDPEMANLDCAQRGRRWVILFDHRYDRNGPR